MKTIEDIFDRMDHWRHFPSYQLERRADLYFSLYLPEVLGSRLGLKIQPNIIPEFPIRVGLLKEKRPDLFTKKNPRDDLSYKVDYAALSEDGKSAVLVELKTEMRSKRDEQDRYMEAAGDLPFKMIVEGIKQIFMATTLNRKYYCLLEYLESMGQINIPPKMKMIIKRKTLQGIKEAAKDIEIKTKDGKPRIVYIQPKIKPKDQSPGTIITFKDFCEIVEQKYDDPLSLRFVRSLKEWSKNPAGSKSV